MSGSRSAEERAEGEIVAGPSSSDLARDGRTGERPLGEVCAAFGKLGWISFGGPVAHLGYFHGEFVRRRRWLDDAEYADLIALCQFLPGPASSQAVFALGMRRAGFLGAIAATLCFLLPSAALMIAFAYGIAAPGALEGAGWIHGLELAAAAVVAQAVWGMAPRLAPDLPRLAIAFAAAALVRVAPGAWIQVAAIAAGMVAGAALLRGRASASVSVDPAPGAASELERPVAPARAPGRAHIPGRRLAAAALIAFAALLVLLPALAEETDSRTIDAIDGFYRSGALVFGGGHVVLPLLRAEVVPPGWVGDDAFLAGYGAAQAVPGPLFSFAGYLGAAIDPVGPPWLGGIACLAAVFLPSWLLIAGALPFWQALRARTGARAALAGANAAVVGLLLAALHTPIATEALRAPADLIAVLAALMLLQFGRAPAWTIVLAGAAAGEWLLPL